MRRLLLLLPLVLLTACGGDGGRADAISAAEDWLQAVADRDTGRACELTSPSGVAALRKKYAGLGDGAGCAAVVLAYRDGFKEADLKALAGVTLEGEGQVKDDELGVFPASGPRELQVILMRRGDDGWKVASTSLDPRGAAAGGS